MWTKAGFNKINYIFLYREQQSSWIKELSNCDSMKMNTAQIQYSQIYNYMVFQTFLTLQKIEHVQVLEFKLKSN